MCMYVCYVHEVVVLCTAFPWMPACLEDRSRPPLGLRGCAIRRKENSGPGPSRRAVVEGGFGLEKKGCSGPSTDE